ncbi:DUF5110 domain-containing protein [Blautia liquoris]|uniref:DUF5110 domain-containing protein n=1 Tax=Blautia liquoris TaxID=2779518 RepID=A0A7M2RIV1_9FIRM|nr:TIM-barrel domain-containing protein [Blautia liquoris]QOV20256.1 DUF5110 domain-containing protein [Blautia liquoris]
MKISSWNYNDYEATIRFHEEQICLRPISERIIRCVYTKRKDINEDSYLIEKKEKTNVGFQVTEDEKCVKLITSSMCVEIEKDTGLMCWKDALTGTTYLQEAGKTLTQINKVQYTTGGEAPVIERKKTVDGERNFISNLKPKSVGTTFRGQLKFSFADDEGIYGLGQGEEGIYNYRHHVQYLYQHNMRIPMPVFLSTRRYGILVDCCSLMTFNDDERGSYLYMDSIDQMDYYFITGTCMDDLVSDIRELTGRSAMLPKWAYGYIQSKEQYHSADELVEVAKKYRELDVPIDCVVQDWNSWEPGKWGEKILDQNRYGNMKDCAEKLKKMHVHSMVSVWPNMNKGGENYTEFLEQGYLLSDNSTYNVFDEHARSLYWKQAKEGLFDQGFDSWWCDSTEPFTGADWNGPVKREPWERYVLVGEDHKKFLGADKANIFALLHAKGMYENQRKTTDKKRVLNLTRSGYLSGSKYGAVLWSGDIYASWDTLKKQIVEGLNVGLSGYPYWTLDIGGFFTVGSKWQNRGCGANLDPSPKWFWCGEYDDGINDLGYCELYTRWLEFACFLPMFRSHGTDTPREIWNFGKRGTIFYDAIEKFINLRYQLMPYIYSAAANVHRNHGTIMRSLVFDFLDDEKAREICDEFMFGPSILVCPVTQPMYYEANSKELSSVKQRECYLPAGCNWYDFWTNEGFTGGQKVTVPAPLDRIPLFVKEGSIIPTARGLQYADDIPEKGIEYWIYPGKDASFELYDDEGDNYNFEKDVYTLTRAVWNNDARTFKVENVSGTYHRQPKEERYTVTIMDVSASPDTQKD